MLLRNVTEFRGFKLPTDVELNTKITAIVGRNGAGKTRLLDAIGNAVSVLHDGNEIPLNQIQKLSLEKLKPGLVFGFDRFEHAKSLEWIRSNFAQYQTPLSEDLHSFVNTFGRNLGNADGVTAASLACAAEAASQALSKTISELDGSDVAEFHSASQFMQLGTLNVTAIFLEYLARQEQNEINLFRNERFGQNLPYRTPEEFEMLFGRPPWEQFNDTLKFVLDGRYEVEVPNANDWANYEARLIQAGGKSIDSSSLSSGEQTLLWLCLSRYAVSSRLIRGLPQLLLFDEPDSTLHPQMIQKMHSVLKDLSEQVACGIIFTTHSPTTIALFGEDSVFRVSESDGLAKIGKDEAIAELLVGVDQVSIHYTNRRQVYVESDRDAYLYQEIFRLLREWNKIESSHISLAFIPAAPKLSPNLVEQILLRELRDISADTLSRITDALNGQGNCVQVIGTVETLVDQGNPTVHGVVDWDERNRCSDRIHVHAPDLFYSFENAILNPVTLGFYLLSSHRKEVTPSSMGLSDSSDLIGLFDDPTAWQLVADSVTNKVIEACSLNRDVECEFLFGSTVQFDKRYVFMNGHDLQAKIVKVFPFLKAFSRWPGLMGEVLLNGVASCSGRTLPRTFVRLFSEIQAG